MSVLLLFIAGAALWGSGFFAGRAVARQRPAGPVLGVASVSRSDVVAICDEEIPPGALVEIDLETNTARRARS